MTGRLLFVTLFVAVRLAMAGDPAMRVVKAAGLGTPLLANGGFEQVCKGKAAAWTGWQQGYRLAPGQGRNGSQAVTCERRDGDGEHGASQELRLDRTNIAPLIIRGWSKAERVSGSPDNGYSLYVDVIYTDGTPLWGQAASFTCGTHDWEKREFVLVPDKPVWSLTLHCLFRGHTGKVWFDDASVEEVQTPAGAVQFEGASVCCSPPKRPGGRASSRTLQTRDGLRLDLIDWAVASLQLDGRELSSPAPSGFLARDFAADSDIYAFHAGGCEELGLKVQADLAANRDHLAIQGLVTNTTLRDRAITLLFALPLDATGWLWGDDAGHSRRIEGSGEFSNTINLHCGANGKMSLYPFGALWNDNAGLALGLDMDYPAQYRLVYHAGTKQLFIAYDFGLTRDTRRFPGSARFRFVCYRFDPRWGFRAALQKYYDLFPQHFVKRVTREGVWMPFTDIAKVPGQEDFGFAFQEGAPDVAFDDQHGIASFVYVEPMSHWLAMPAGVPRTYDSSLAVLKQDLAGARTKDEAQMAAATFTSGIQNAEGQFSLYLVKAPWCDGGVFTLNPDPDIPTTPEHLFTKASVMLRTIDDAFSKNQPRAPLPGIDSPAWPPGPGLDGVYLDSLEMSCAQLNYRREHFECACAPLVFDRDGRPCQLMIFNTWAFEREIASRLHARGKLLFANDALWQFSFPAPLLDVLGTEVNWLDHGKYHPDSDRVMNFRRALCRQKPYCLLMNTDFSRFTPDLVERFFQRCLAYGVWPGFFDEEAASKDPYWASARKWYERDRPLFRKYVPLLRRLTAAGWQPLTFAHCDNPSILVERFGPDADGNLFLTLLNNANRPEDGTMVVDRDALSLADPADVRELVAGRDASPAPGGWRLSLAPQQAEILLFSPRRK
ncbi:MAG TPA: hypothetical protein VMU04_04480 [Candidatus Acidoferrum sp.]|nr:hypothetical protein [Candidatus Acidoferrum sp.]